MHEAGVGETVDGNEAQGGAEYHQVLPARLAGEDSWVSLDRVGRKALRSGRSSVLESPWDGQVARGTCAVRELRDILGPRGRP